MKVRAVWNAKKNMLATMKRYLGDIMQDGGELEGLVKDVKKAGSYLRPIDCLPATLLVCATWFNRSRCHIKVQVKCITR